MFPVLLARFHISSTLSTKHSTARLSSALVTVTLSPSDSKPLQYIVDPSNYQAYDQEIFNRHLPIWSTFEPGSTFKLVTYAAVLEAELMSLNDEFNSVGLKTCKYRNLTINAKK